MLNETPEDQIFYTIHNPQLLYRCRIPELIGTQIRACFHGWVVLAKHPAWFLWNPLTSKMIRLPPLIHMKVEPDQCCLSSPPDDPNSVFLLVTHKYPTLTFCRLDCTRNNLKWAKFSYAKQLKRIIGKTGYLHDPTCCNGKVYAFDSDEDNFIEIDIAVEEKKVVIRLLPFVEHPGFSFTRFRPTDGLMVFDCYLKGYCSELFYIEIGNEDETKTVGDVHLYKLDMSNKKWKTSKMLYFLYKMGKQLYSYHVKNRTILIASMSSLVPTSDMTSWGMLECRLEGDHANMKQEDEDDGNTMVKSGTKVKALSDGKKRERTDESHLVNMPFHILEMIMEHCVCVEYMNFRATCKILSFSSSFSTLEQQNNVKEIANIFSSFTMVDECALRRMMFFNPLTSDIRELPLVGNLDGCCFSAPPTSKDCMVAGSPPTSKDCMVSGCNLLWHRLHRYFVGQEQLLCSSYMKLGGDVPYSFRFPTFHDKDIYALCNDGRLDVIRETGEEEYSLKTVVAKPPSCGGSSFLVECEQNLLLVIVGTLDESVDLFKLNDFTKEWEKLDGLVITHQMVKTSKEVSEIS
ncbi:hypothetical protein CTI12_AA303240 [Artemisia annua]|uniref:KIB1-4 beta-propeller domain-containing protein n=1 Tax=Artemisia annua TaxID=35608 RepID=A0A2U1N515_ARTAN|nr:hypothetical protein CTI12_AA303240 [Artemisia annua]